MQQNIAMKFAEYMVWVILCKHREFGEKMYYNSRDIEFFLWVTFLALPVHRTMSFLMTLT